MGEEAKKGAAHGGWEAAASSDTTVGRVAHAAPTAGATTRMRMVHGEGGARNRGDARWWLRRSWTGHDDAQWALGREQLPCGGRTVTSPLSPIFLLS
ncbi:sel1 repeat family protein [Sesbania bispinosa]|nr:sel1 repeat family protein [Sesbania bispinosa]